MPAITNPPVQSGDQYVIRYDALATATPTDHTFPSTQDTVTIFNLGSRNIEANGIVIEPNDSEKLKSTQVINVKSLAPSQIISFRLEGRVKVGSVGDGTIDTVARNLTSYLDANKADKSYVDTVIGNKANKSELDETIGRLEEAANQKEITLRSKNLLRNAEFEILPNIQPRSSVYAFTPGVTSPQYKTNKSLKIEVSGYESSPDPNKDFSFILTEKIKPNDRVKVSFWAYPSTSGKVIRLRMAYASVGVDAPLGEANKWNKVEVELNTSTMSQSSVYLYCNFNSSFVAHFSDFRVENDANVTKNIPNSFNLVNEQLIEHPSAIHNSDGIIERMIKVAQSYYDNVNNFVYGNRYTAYDATQTLVGGKYQIDCSSFANLMIHGVTYENSKYAGKSENIHNKLFFHNIDSYKWRFAHQMAEYASQKGYAFKPNADYSNLEPGDILFFSWNSGVSGDLEDGTREHAFMKIDHVAVYLHKRDDSRHATMQFDTNISTVYYNASNGYMSQCVLAARFPFANVAPMYPKENILEKGNEVKNVTNVVTVNTYSLTKPLRKGNYYTFVIDGNVLTPNCYFVIQANGQTIFSDSGTVLPYEGVTEFRFPYHLTSTATEVSLLIGAPGGTDSNRSANVNWCALYEGYVRNKKDFEEPSKNGVQKDFPLDATLIPDLGAGLVPYYKYMVDGNKIFINFSLPFSTLRTGNLVLGQMGIYTPKTTQRMPINLIGATGEAVNATLQFSSSGTVTIIPYSGTTQWKLATANGIIFRN